MASDLESLFERSQNTAKLLYYMYPPRIRAMHGWLDGWVERSTRILHMIPNSSVLSRSTQHKYIAYSRDGKLEYNLYFLLATRGVAYMASTHLTSSPRTSTLPVGVPSTSIVSPITVSAPSPTTTSSLPTSPGLSRAAAHASSSSSSRRASSSSRRASSSSRRASSS
jgi:hypothetical protein